MRDFYHVRTLAKSLPRSSGTFGNSSAADRNMALKRIEEEQ